MAVEGGVVYLAVVNLLRVVQEIVKLMVVGDGAHSKVVSNLQWGGSLVDASRMEEAVAASSRTVLNQRLVPLINVWLMVVAGVARFPIAQSPLPGVLANARHTVEVGDAVTMSVLSQHKAVRVFVNLTARNQNALY